MQIIEQSVVGVRSAVLRLTRRDTPLRFEIYPMVHVGEPAFYAAVTRRLRRCDLVVAEGVGTSPSASLLTESYRLPARFERSGLVVQDIDYAALGVPVVNPDLSGAEFDAGWRALPLSQRAILSAAAPLMGIDQLLFGSRRALARQLELTDVEWHDRAVEIDSTDQLYELILDRRDRRLVEALDGIHRDRCHEAITVAVVYGAWHVPPLIDGLRGLHRYTVRGAEWLTVFSF
jgi:hypothetical protein